MSDVRVWTHGDGRFCAEYAHETTLVQIVAHRCGVYMGLKSTTEPSSQWMHAAVSEPERFGPIPSSTDQMLRWVSAFAEDD